MKRFFKNIAIWASRWTANGVDSYRAFGNKRLAIRDLVKDDYDQLCNIVLIGDSVVGKTDIMSRFSNNKLGSEFNPTSTIVRFSTRTIEVDGKKIKVQIWDMVGSERYSVTTGTYYRGADGAIMVYDITKRTSFDDLQRWLLEIRKHSISNIVVMMVGKKSDLNHFRVVSKQDGLSLAEKEGFSFFETSTLTLNNIERAFHMVVTDVYNYRVLGKKRLVVQEVFTGNIISKMKMD